MKIELTATMSEFIARQVREGRAASEAEFVRFLIANAIRDWEKVHRHAYDVTVELRSEK